MTPSTYVFTSDRISKIVSMAATAPPIFQLDFPRFPGYEAAKRAAIQYWRKLIKVGL